MDIVVFRFSISSCGVLSTGADSGVLNLFIGHCLESDMVPHTKGRYDSFTNTNSHAYYKAERRKNVKRMESSNN